MDTSHSGLHQEMERAKHTGSVSVCLPWCGIGWLNNVEHIEINALGTISLNLLQLNNGQAVGMKINPDSCTASEATSKLWISHFHLSTVN
jgi:hypothetical protein